GSPAGAARSERRGSAQVWSERRGSEQLAEAKQVEDACLHLELAGEPGTRETPWIFREGDQVVAVRGEADLRGPVLAVSLPDRASAVRAQPRHERDPKISHVAADSAVDEMSLPVGLVHLGDPAGQFFQGQAAFLSGRHETPL